MQNFFFTDLPTLFFFRPLQETNNIFFLASANQRTLTDSGLSYKSSQGPSVDLWLRPECPGGLSQPKDTH